MEPAKTYIIQHKETKELFRARSGKTSWKLPGHAKNAWNTSVQYKCHTDKYNVKMIRDESLYWRKEEERHRPPKFDEQGVWEIVELKTSHQTHLERAVALLELAMLSVKHDSLWGEIVEFLKEVENE